MTTGAELARFRWGSLTIAERLAKWSDRTRGPEACWPWTGVTDRDGYGRLRVDGRYQGAHRLALEEELGRPLRPGMFACHSCDNPPCVNGSHLFEGTQSDNERDARAKGRNQSRPPRRHASASRPAHRDLARLGTARRDAGAPAGAPARDAVASAGLAVPPAAGPAPHLRSRPTAGD